MQKQMFGEILQYERKKKGISKKKLSEMTGFTERAISYWETGERDISFRNADIVAKALKISITIGEKKG